MSEINDICMKPINVVDEFGDSTLSCPQCKEPIRFPLIRDPWHINDERPLYCRFCGIAFDWSKGKEE